MSEIIIALITLFGTVVSISGVIAFVFIGTKALVREIHVTNKEIHATTVAIYETNKEMRKEAEQRHREVIELLKRGFGDLSSDMTDVKEAIMK